MFSHLRLLEIILMKKFVSIQIDAENPANRQVVKQNKVRSYPTLGFFDADENYGPAWKELLMVPLL